MKRLKEKEKGISFGPLKGFTLIELMVVVVIIALILTVAIVAINRARERTRDAIIMSQLEQIQVLGETIYNPETGYKELYDMRERDHNSIIEIENKIDEMGLGRNFALWFSCESVSPEIDESCNNFSSQYCSYVYLISKEDTVFCVDSSGFSGKIDVSGNQDIHCMARESTEDTCNYR